MVIGLINHSRFMKYDSPALWCVNSIALWILRFFLTIYHIRNTIYEKCRETTFLDITERVN